MHPDNIRPVAPLSFAERIEILRNKPEFKLAIGFLVIVLIGGYVFGTKFLGETKEVATPSVVSTTTTAPESISVYITGAVNKPGVYELEKNSRVIDLLEKAQDVSDTAELSECNLAAKLTDGMMVKIPSKGDKETTCSGLANATGSDISNSNSPQAVSKVNLNTASQAELETLPGVGPSTAISIITYRQSKQFKSINDLRNVKGIGEKKFADLKDHIEV